MKIVNGIAVLEDDSHISQWVIETNRLDHDQYFLKHIDPFIPIGGVVLDIGAYIGDHTIYYLNKVGANGKVLAFEPNKRSFECLNYNLGSYKNCQLFNNPVSNVKKYFDVVEPNENIGMAFIQDGKQVESIIIDDLNLDKVDFIKIDVEGFEIEVLEGCKKTLEKFSPTLIIEVNTHTLNRFGLSKENLFNKLKEMGYLFKNIYNWISITDSGDQFDILCTKA